MAKSRPYLVFVSGPQEGWRVMLHSRPMEAGRVPTADIQLTENYSSRRQMLFRRRGDEWTVENLSTNGTRINGRNYREGQQIILGTGDLIGIGAETRILYVGPEDDPDEVLRQWHEDHETGTEAEQGETGEQPADAEKPQPAPTPAADNGDAPVTGRLPTGPLTSDLSAPGSEQEEEDAEEADRERSAKRKKYLMFAMVYGVGFIVLLAVLYSLRGDGGTLEPTGMPPVLGEEDIRDAIETSLRRPANPSRGVEMLERAEMYYYDRHLREGNLYRAVKCFKLHLAYAGRSDFAELKHSRMHRDATQELARMVTDQYRHAYRLLRNRDWSAADDAFRRLQRIYPAAGEPEPRSTDPVMNPEGPVWSNIVEHLTYIRRRTD